MRWRLAAAALLTLLLGSVPSLAQTPVTIVGPITVGNCVQFFSPVQIKDAGVVCGGAAGAVQSVGNFAADTSLTIAGVGTGPWNGAVTIKLTTPVTLANGGTNNSLTASNGGIVWSDASKLNILAGTVTAGQCLLSGSSAAPSWGACGGGGGAVSSVTNADGTLVISPTTGAVVSSLNLAHANTWTALQKHILAGDGLLISNNAAATALTNQGIDIAEDGAPGSVTITTYGVVGTTNMPTFVGQSARGSLASPAVVVANDVLASFSGRGYIGSGFAATGRGFVRILSSETWSTTGNGTYISFVTTPNATTATAEALRIENDGGMTVPATVTGGDKGAGSINVGSLFIGGTALTLPVSLANGGTSNGLTASAGGIVWSDASKLNILAGTVTSGQCLLSGNLAAPSWGSCSGGAAVSSVSNADGTLTISPTTGAVISSLNLAHANTWTGAQTHINSGILLLGSSTGATTFTSANASASNFTLTFPAATDQLVARATTDTLTNKTYDTAATGNVFKIAGTTITAISGNTGTVGTTSGAFVSGNCVKTDVNHNLVDNGAVCGGGGGTPGGANTNVQFNNSGAFGGDSGFTYAGTGQATLALGTITTNKLALNITGTWNNAATTFDAPLFMNITNTASNAASNFFDFQSSGVSLFALQQLAGLSRAVLVMPPNSQIAPGNALHITNTPGGTRGILIGGAAGVITLGLNGLLSWNSALDVPAGTTDLNLIRDAAGILAQQNSTSAQTFRVYNTFTNASNYERGVFDWTTTANVLTIGTEAAGTGTVRNLKITVGGVNVFDYGVNTAGTVSVGQGNGVVNLAQGSLTSNGSTGNTSLFLNGVLSWANTAVGLAYHGSGAVLEVNAGTRGTINGDLMSRSFISGGSVPVDGGGSCLASSFAGGATAGTFSAAVCSAGTIAITFAMTAPTGWSCDAEDRTTPATGKLQQTASTTTKATFLATNSAADVIQYKCIAY